MLGRILVGLMLTATAGLGGTEAAILPVGPGESIQAAIDLALPDDVVDVAAGEYVEDIDFGGKAITVQGAGPDTILRGTGGGSVVTFASGEGPDSVLDSLQITGGRASEGGGVHVAGASPTLIRLVVIGNAAVSRGSGIYVGGAGAAPRIQNSILMYNVNAGGDPHTIEAVGAAPVVVNNTIVRNDSNGIILRGNSPAEIRNNAILLNGSKHRGRGICDFSGGVARIAYNLFWRNRKAALLTDGLDFRRIGRAERFIGPPRVMGNGDGNPEMVERRAPRIGSRRFESMTVGEIIAGLHLRPDARRRNALDVGDPDPAYDDLDGTRNDVGFTGGPAAPPW